MKNKNMMRMSSENGRWQGGKSPTFYRRVAGAKPKEIVHHRNGRKTDNSNGNVEVLKSDKYSNALAKHNKAHPEKITKANKARGL